MLTLVIFLLVLGLLVFVHEFGHFAAAKLCKVRVDEFNIGFPPRLLKFKKGETLYSINIIPLGGYVKIKGEDGEGKGDPDSFASKPIWTRSIIIAAGVIMNFVLAVILISLGYGLGLPTPVDDKIFMKDFANFQQAQVQIISVLDDSPAQKAGLDLGDVILSINGQEMGSVTQVQEYVRASKDKELDFEILRGDETFVKKLNPVPMVEAGDYGVGVNLLKIAMVSYPWPIAILHGIYRSFALIYEILRTLVMLVYQLLVGQVSDMPVAGPVGIAVITGKMASLGFVYLLQFIAILSINLAIINFLPFPALDGSKILFLIVEKIRGRAVNENLEGLIHTIGFAALMLLMLVITYKDIIRYGGNALKSIGGFF